MSKPGCNDRKHRTSGVCLKRGDARRAHSDHRGELIMKARASKRLALGAVLIMATLSMYSAFADGTRPFKIRFAAGFVQNIQQAQVDMTGTPTGVVESRGIALGKGRGTFGRVDIMAVTSSGPPVSDKSCSADLIKVADIVENNLLLTFSDLSLLYGNGTGVVCFNPADPTAFPIVEIEGTWDGGTGRFGSAGGNWSLRFGVAEPVGVATQFIAETGVITGRLTGLHDN